MKNKNLKWIFKILGFASLGLIGIVVTFLTIQIVKAPNFSEINAGPEGYLSTILDKNGEAMNTLYVSESNRIYVDLNNIPKELQEAFIAIEDERFYEHHGIDPKGMVRAFVHGIKNGGFTQGGSTITQQLLKNNVFTDWMSEKTFYDSLCRKVQEQFLAVRLEQNYSKEWILENYLNTINLGGGTRGVQVASQYYFGKDVSKLSLGECALIAGITKNPTTYNPILNPEKSLERQELVLNAMLAQKLISPEAYEQAISEDVIGNLADNMENRKDTVYSWFEDALLQEIVKDLTATYRYEEAEAWDLIYSGGLTIHSTVDVSLQEMCENIVTNPEWYGDNEEISMVITDVKTGAVRAIVGSSKEKAASLVYNRATDAVRQPGSTIKIIGEYAALLDSGKGSLGMVMNDEPYTYSNGSEIRNSYGTFRGMTTIRDAIVSSSNVIALKAYQLAGEAQVFHYLEKFGLTTLTEEDKHEAIAIGGTYHGVTNLEMTGAYNAIANKGQYIRPYFYTKVLDRQGNVLLEEGKNGIQIIKADTARLLTSAMQDVISRGTGAGATVGGVSLAGKSGTTNEIKDAWFIGFSSEYTCGIWGGHDDHSSQNSSSYVKKIWQKVMKEAHAQVESQPLFTADLLVRTEICKKCGNLAIKGICDSTLQGNMIYEEYFTEDTVPTEACDCHVEVIICEESGHRAASACPNSRTKKKVYLLNATAGTEDAAYVLPKELEETCTQHKYFWEDWRDSWKEIFGRRFW